MKNIIHTVITVVFCLFVASDALAEMKEIKSSVACNYLKSIGLATRGWKNHYDDVYGCSSPYKEFGSGYPLKNNLAYYVDGTATNVKQLKLVVNVNNRAEEKRAHSELLKAAEVLTKQYLNKPLSESIRGAITAGKDLSSEVGDTTVEIIRDDWPTGKGYEIKFIIK